MHDDYELNDAPQPSLAVLMLVAQADSTVRNPPVCPEGALYRSAKAVELINLTGDTLEALQLLQQTTADSFLSRSDGKGIMTHARRGANLLIEIARLAAFVGATCGSYSDQVFITTEDALNAGLALLAEALAVQNGVEQHRAPAAYRYSEHLGLLAQYAYEVVEPDQLLEALRNQA